MEVNRTSHVVKYPQKTPSAAFMGIILKYKQNSVHSVDYFNFFVYYFYSYFFFSLKNGERKVVENGPVKFPRAQDDVFRLIVYFIQSRN